MMYWPPLGDFDNSVSMDAYKGFYIIVTVRPAISTENMFRVASQIYRNLGAPPVMRNWPAVQKFASEKAACTFGLQEARVWIDQQGIPDNKLFPLSIEPLNQRINQLAGEIGAMDPDDPRCVELIDEISALSLIRVEMKPKG